MRHQSFRVIQGRLVFEVKTVSEEGFVGLFLNGLVYTGLAIANIRNDSPGTRIDIFFSIGIPDLYPLGMVDNW